jgi:hypothetical protein
MVEAVNGGRRHLRREEPEMTTKDEMLTKVDEQVEKAFNAERLADSWHAMKVAAGLYRSAGTLSSAKWAEGKATVIARMMEKVTA